MLEFLLLPALLIARLFFSCSAAVRPRREPEPVVREKAGPAPPGGAWSEAEDKQLRSMCAKDGPGDWDGKASRFTANRGRTASSLRQRWAKLQAAAAAGGGALEGDVSRWTEEEDLQLRKLVVKLGTNDWKRYDEWPPAAATPKSLYLQ